MTTVNAPEPEDDRTAKNSVDELCVALGIRKGDLYYLLTHLPRYYHVQHSVSASGKQRTFYVAHGQLVAIHTKLMKSLARLPIHDAAHGWRSGRSIKTAATIHVGKNYVISLDVADFFPTITPRRIRNLFINLGCSVEIAVLLTKLTTWNGQLAQGLKTSPALANLVMRDIDRRIRTACRELQFEYTRFGDDITLSGDKVIKHIESVVTSILRQTGFKIKQEKTEKSQKHVRQTALKLVVNEKPNLPREKRRQLRAMAHNCLVKGFGTEQQEGEDLKKTEARIRGHLSHWKHIDHQAAQSSLRKLEQARKRMPPVDQRLA